MTSSAILSWCPYSRAQYGSWLRALASYTVRTGPSLVAEALVGVLTERARMGATTSSIRGFTSAVRAVEDLQSIPPAVTTLHKRIAASHPRYGEFFDSGRARVFRLLRWRLPFGRKYSPYFCQLALARVLQGVLPSGVLLVHYLDDFLLVYTEEGVLREAGRAVVRALVEAGFLIRPKSVLDPVQLVSFSGKALNLALQTVACHTKALLQLWVGWMRLALGDGGGQHLRSYLCLLNWHVRPRGLGGPFGTGAWCWLRWGRTADGEQQPSQGLPVKLLEGLATLAALAAEPHMYPTGKA